MYGGPKKYLRVGVAVSVCLAIGFIAGMATQSSVDSWYRTLEKPFFTPPDSLFAPVWGLLYILMGWAAGLIWARGLHHRWVKTALYFFGFQLLLNGSWSIVFFGLREPLWALIILVALLALILITIKWFRIVSKTAAFLLIPYLAWVIFAGCLNAAIVWLN